MLNRQFGLRLAELRTPGPNHNVEEGAALGSEGFPLDCRPGSKNRVGASVCDISAEILPAS